MTLKDKMKHTAAMKVYDYVDKDPENNIPVLLDQLIEADDSDSVTRQAAGIKSAFAEKDGNWRKLVLSLWTDVDAKERRRLFETAAINGSLIGSGIQKQYQKKYGCNIPWTILMDPTSACNLKCTGCWAAEYGHKLNLTLEELEDIIAQGEEFGCYIYLYSGGEPMVRKSDILTLCRRHPECAFLAFTNGTLIDEAFADAMLEVGNFIPAISVEGFEKDTDFRRGAGTFQKVLATMELLKRKKLLFGISCCYTSQSAEFIGSEAYFDAMVDWGAKFCWFFTYMPIGKAAVPSLMATAEQRAYMYRQVRAFRKTKPLFTMDFWNDGEFVGGCIAGGRSFLHINAGGDIEPCGFIHYADSNIRTDRLLDAFRKPLFMAYHENQPFNKNMLRPCPVLDNPGRLTQMVERSGAHSTDILAEEAACDYCGKCVDKAKAWAPVAAELWKKSGKSE
ncbi:MAG: radical SAM protein [Oscillospiraceae bacterium]|nr:radical SAM protein [Oscillospiraceae bacterium]